MSDHEAKQATPPETLLVALLDSRVPKSEREHAAKREIERLRQWELVGREWIDKTDWMQSNDAPARWLGRHRADCLREEIERLTAENTELRRQLDEAERDAERYRWLRANRQFCDAAYPDGEWAVPAGIVFLGYNNHDADSWIDAAMGLTRPAEEA